MVVNVGTYWPEVLTGDCLHGSTILSILLSLFSQSVMIPSVYLTHPNHILKVNLAKRILCNFSSTSL